jgi:PAS domain S-box-containing protein
MALLAVLLLFTPEQDLNGLYWIFAILGGSAIAGVFLFNAFDSRHTPVATRGESTLSIVEQMPVALFSTDEHGIIRYVNSRASKTFSYAIKDLIGHHISVVLPTTREEMRLPDQTGTLTVKGDDEGRRKDGQRFPVRLYVRPSRLGTEVRTLIAVEDLTKEREIEKMKQDFMAMVSHDLRTPINAIANTVTLLRQGIYGSIPDKASERLKVSEEVLDRLIKLINDLLQIEKMGSGTFSMDLGAIPVDDVFSPALESVQAAADAREITFVFKTKETFGKKIKADRDRIVQVLINMMSNAIKYAPEGETVQVSSADKSDHVVISVFNPGPAIPKEKQEAIFEKYKQADAVGDVKRGGIGLGLAICKSIVEQHHGTIGVDSEEGKGTTFWFTVPKAQVSVPAG